MNFQKLFQILLSKHIKMGYLRDPRIKEILGNLPLERLLTEERREAAMTDEERAERQRRQDEVKKRQEEEKEREVVRKRQREVFGNAPGLERPCQL